jgi:LysM repeat protein
MANLETASDASVANQTYAATENWAEAPKTNNLSDLAQELMSSHAHRPGLVQEDLAKATEALHANGSLANLSIIGLDGKDLIARDDQGQTLLLDSSNPDNQQVLPADLVTQPIGESGRTAELAADGSGKYTVVSGDSCWRIANDILTSQGVEQPTDNQIANYIKELETSNGRSFAQLQVGDAINIPTKIQGGESSRFAAPDSTDSTNPETTIPADATVPADTAIPTDTSVPELSAEAAKQMELEKFGIDTSYALMGQGFERATEHFTPRGTYAKPSATLYDINSTLNRSDLTNNEKLGLQMVQSQYDFLKSSEDGNIHLRDLDSGKAQSYQEIEAKYSQGANTEFDPYAGIFPEVTVTAPTPAPLPY